MQQVGPLVGDQGTHFVSDLLDGVEKLKLGADAFKLLRRQLAATKRRLRLRPLGHTPRNGQNVRVALAASIAHGRMPDQEPMTTSPSGASFEIKVDDVVRTHRDQRDIEAARLLQQRNPGAKITVTDLCDGSQIPFTG